MGIPGGALGGLCGGGADAAGRGDAGALRRFALSAASVSGSGAPGGGPGRGSGAVAGARLSPEPRSAEDLMTCPSRAGSVPRAA